MNNNMYLIPGKNSRALYHTFYNNTKRVQVVEDRNQEYPVVALRDMVWYLVHKNLVMCVDLKLYEGRWYIIPSFHINYSNVMSWDYADVRDLDNQQSTDLVLDAFIQYNDCDKKYHIVETANAGNGQIFLPAEEIWNSPNLISVPNVIRQLTILGRYDGKGSRSYRQAYEGFTSILQKRGICYFHEDINRLIHLGEFMSNDDEIIYDFNRRRLSNKRIEPIKLTYKDGCISGDGDQISIRLQYGSQYHTDQVAKLLNI